MNYKSLLSAKEKSLLLIAKLPWRFKKLCPGYLRELDQTCKKILIMGGAIKPMLGKLEVTFLENNYFLRVGTSDFLVFDQVILEREYQPIVDLIKKKEGNDRKLNIIDAGANVGFASLYFSASFKESSVIGLEPDQNNFQAYIENISLNNKIGRITPMQAGIWGTDREMVLNDSFRDGREWALSLKEARDHENGSVKINGYSLQTILSKNSLSMIDFLKIDIEGGEKNLFDHWAEENAVFKLIKFIAIEIHDEIADRKFINSLLKKNGFEIVEIGETTFGENKNLV